MSGALSIRPGAGTLVRQTLQGFSLSRQAEARQWRHPWFTRVTWQPASQTWVATVKAGYVNGIPPIYRTTVREQAAHERDFGVNPLTGQPYFSSGVFAQSQATEGERTQTLDLPLYLSPAIVLEQWRVVGAPGPGGETLPGEIAVYATTEETTSAQERQLVAIDLVLHQPRLGLTSRNTIEPGLLTGQGIARQVLEIRAPAAGDVLRVYAGRLLPASPPDPLADIYEEPAWDERKIATVYLVSAPGVPRHTRPDGSWTPYVKHELFWNLSWMPARTFRQPGGATSTPFVLLYGGAAQTLVNTLTSAMNDFTQDAFNRITQNSQAGTWWTPTGGGHEAELPPVPSEATAGALSKSGQLALQRQRSAAQSVIDQAAAGLDPAFPYRVIGFDPARLN